MRCARSRMQNPEGGDPPLEPSKAQMTQVIVCAHSWTQVNQFTHGDGFSEKLYLCDRCRTSWMDPRDPEPRVVIGKIEEAVK